MTDQQCTCRSVPRERFLDRECQIHGDVETDRRAGRVLDCIQRRLDAGEPLRDVLGDYPGEPVARVAQAFLEASPEKRRRMEVILEVLEEGRSHA